jgi:hypothetical protein
VLAFLLATFIVIDYDFCMAWHWRHIFPAHAEAPAGGLRTTVTFVRRDLLWVPEDRLTDPYTRRPVPVPFPRPGTEDRPQPLYFGPNVLDLVTRTVPEPLESATVPSPDDGSPRPLEPPGPRVVWALREPQAFFEQPAKRGLSPHPFKKALCAGGQFVAYEQGFLVVEKRSSVSVSTLVYRLAIGMHGSFDAASRSIGALAAAAWARDLVRARDLYTLVRDQGGSVADAAVPATLRAQATVSQEVEAAILREACQWLGVDPDRPLARRRGRPGTRRGTTAAGAIIELMLHADGSVTGRLLVAYAGLPQGTALAVLTLTKLAELLVALREATQHEDAELLEAYLDAVDPAWRDRIAEELAVPSGRSGDDPWTVLGVAPGASLETIKKAYRRAMRVIHPDTSGLSDWFAKRVNDAYRQLLQEVHHG